MQSKWTDGEPSVAAQRQVSRTEMVRDKPARFVKAESVLSADWHPSLDGVVTGLQCGEMVTFRVSCTERVVASAGNCGQKVFHHEQAITSQASGRIIGTQGMGNKANCGA